jgi:ferredoxin
LRRIFLRASFPYLIFCMIGEDTHSTNQRRHTYVRDHVEVGFFTGPTVCIGCKACEVACKEWNDVPNDGFVWSGNSYDNTGHLGASTWRHVMFVEQDRQKGGQIVGSRSLGNTNEEDPFAGFSSRMFASTARKLVASRLVPPERSFAPKLARCLCRTTFATAAGIASSHALLA